MLQTGWTVIPKALNNTAMNKLLFVTLLSCMMLFCSCSRKNDTEPVLLTGVSAETTTLTADENSTPSRVVSLSPAITEIIFELGYGDRLVAVGEYCDRPDGAAVLPRAGSAANFDKEKILAFAPDLVITESPVSKTDMTDMADNGVTVMKLSAPNSLAGLKEQYAKVAAVWDEDPETAAENALKGLTDTLESVYYTDSEIMLFLSNHSPATPDTLAGDLIGTFGVNGARGYHSYNMPDEKIIMTDPDIIILSDRLDYFRFTEDFSELTAVKNNRIIIIDGEYLERPTSRLSELVKFISSNLQTVNK